MGKAIYKPKGKAAEYSPWACNFFTGCSNDCDYCYCKRGVLSHVWDNKPHLKKCFKDEIDALRIFNHEMNENLDELRKHGVLFSFSTDPMLPSTHNLTLGAMIDANRKNVPVKILTKCAWFSYLNHLPIQDRSLIAIGFTLTGMDELEPNADTNESRIITLFQVKSMRFKTFASIEPIIKPDRSMEMIEKTLGFCDLYKIGLLSGKKADYDKAEMQKFYNHLVDLSGEHKIYLKDSFIDYLGLQRSELPEGFVDADYNIWKG